MAIHPNYNRLCFTPQIQDLSLQSPRDVKEYTLYLPTYLSTRYTLPLNLSLSYSSGSTVVNRVFRESRTHTPHSTRPAKIEVVNWQLGDTRFFQKRIKQV